MEIIYLEDIKIYILSSIVTLMEQHSRSDKQDAHHKASNALFSSLNTSITSVSYTHLTLPTKLEV